MIQKLVFDFDTVFEHLKKEKGFKYRKDFYEDFGVNEQTVHNWKTGVCLPSGENIFRLIRYTGMEFTKLFKLKTI